MKYKEITDKRLQDIVDKILAVSSPDKIVLYGSRAKGGNGARSDFDIALFGKVNMGQVWDSIQSAQTLLDIDVVSFAELADGAFKQKILAEGVVVYEREI